MNFTEGIKLLTALKSGEFTQTKGFLKTDKGYCCLGVYTEICGVKFKEKTKEKINQMIYCTEDVEEDVFLIKSLQQRLGICRLGAFNDVGSDLSRVLFRENYDSLGELNDDSSDFKKVILFIENGLVEEYLFGRNCFEVNN